MIKDILYFYFHILSFLFSLTFFFLFLCLHFFSSFLVTFSSISLGICILFFMFIHLTLMFIFRNSKNNQCFLLPLFRTSTKPQALLFQSSFPYLYTSEVQDLIYPLILKKKKKTYKLKLLSL